MHLSPTRRFLLAISSLLSLSAILSAAEPKGIEKGPMNRLAKESSPYLLQHAHNPVDWFPWGSEAFEKARKENKLIFLSIGYSSCHWCHVMERESFANKDVAKVLNDNFVCIKVDREERPDVDEIYMTALQTTGQSGGWPLSMFLTHEGKPIFGGTYIPPTDREVPSGKIMGFDTVLKTVMDLNKDKRKEILEQADKIAGMTKEELERSGRLVVLTPLDRTLVAGAVAAHDTDPIWGGIGSKRREFDHTKFPRVSVSMLLLNQARKPGQEAVAKDLELSLRQMAQGGIFDHLGGGFHRYSTERTWTVPHFEKMLYDNAQLVELYAEAYRIKPDPLYRRVVAESLGFVKREMTSPEGGFYSALDADSNGREGEFYVWSLDQLKAALDAEEFDLLRKVYAGGEPNFEKKEYVLRLPKPLSEIAADLKTTEADLLKRLGPIKAKLLEVRSKRERPFLDTKILTGWNGQMIAAYAIAGKVFGEKAWTDTAVKAAEFLLANLRNGEGRLLRVYGARPGEKPTAKINAFLDDYAFLIHGLLALHDATGERRWLDEAKVLADVMIKWYGDTERGGYFFTAHDHEKLFARSKDSYDGAQPSGNGMAALVLLKLAVRAENPVFREHARKLLKQFAGVLKMNPGSSPLMALALDRDLDTSGDATPIKLQPLVPGKEPAKGAKFSADVVKASVVFEPSTGGSQPFTITIAVDAPYHIYAQDVGNKGLQDSATVIEALRDGKKVDASLEFPASTTATDDMLGKYNIHEGKLTIRGRVQAEPGKFEIRVRVSACRDKACLLPSTLTLSPK